MKQLIRLEYSDCFSENPQEISNYFQGISRYDLLRLCPLFLTRKNETVYDYLSSYFTKENNEYVNQLWKNLQERKDNIDNYFVTNIESSLRLYEYVFDNIKAVETTLSGPEIEMNVFKVYLLFNAQINSGDNTASESTKHIQEGRAKALLLAQMFQYFDITNYRFRQELYVQTVKAIYLYEFLSSNEKTQLLYKKYLEYYNCADWQEIMQFMTSFAYIYWGREDDQTYVNLLVDPSDKEYDKKCEFIEKLVIDTDIEDIDFRILRSHPIYKKSKGNYYFVYGYFLLELIYKGVYFKLNELNKLPKNEQIKEFRSFYCDYFSEQTILYNVLKDVYGKKYVHMSGDYIKNEFGIVAEPDYYIRNGNKIFLFESKDILIPSKTKVSNDYENISSELKKRLYYEEKSNGGIDNKAVLQLLNNIQKILKKTAEWDQGYKEKNIRIYPIIILHDNIYNCPGINDLVNIWFEEELEKMKEEYDVSRIENITIINIDVFIVYKDLLQKSESSLDKMISSYHKFVSEGIAKKARTQEEATKMYKDRIISFEYYLSTKYSPDYKKMLTQVAKTYIKE
jgi:hypothetical protein